MQRREVILLSALAAVMIGVGAYFAFSSNIFSGFSLSGNDKLKQEIDEKKAKVEGMEKKQKDWEHYRTLSLPGGTRNTAIEEYHKYLTDLVRDVRAGGNRFDPDYKISNGTVAEVTAAATGSQRSAKPPFVRVNYTINAHGTEDVVTSFLERFYKAPKLHQIHSITLRRPD